MARTYSSNVISAIEDGSFFVYDEIPTGSVNGSNKTFTLTSTPNPLDSVEIFVNGQRIEDGDDYSVSGDTLTMSYAYPSGTSIKINYLTKPI